MARLIRDTTRDGDTQTASARPSSWLKEKSFVEGLRQAYDGVLSEPVPDRLKKVIEEIRQLEARRAR